MTRERVFVVAAVIAVLAIAAWFAWPGRKPAVPVLVSAVPVAPPSEQPRLPTAIELASRATAPPPAYLRHVDPQKEICRQASLAAQPLATFIEPGGPMQPYLETQLEDLRAHLVDQLTRNGGDEQRVAAAILRGDPAEAAELARRSDDGKAYAMAWRYCRGRTSAAIFRRAAQAGSAQELRQQVDEELAVSSAKCDALSLERWAQLEPENASPWLQMAQEARARGDTAATLDAMHRAAQARSLDTGWGWLVGQMADLMPGDAPEAGRMLLYIDVTGRQAAFAGMPDAAQVNAYCDTRSLADGNVRQQCEQLTLLLTQRSPQLAERVIGAVLAKRLLGDAARDERQALDDAQAWMLQDFQQHTDQAGACAALNYLADWMVDVARRGEWAAVQSRRNAGKP